MADAEGAPAEPADDAPAQAAGDAHAQPVGEAAAAPPVEGEPAQPAEGAVARPAEAAPAQHELMVIILDQPALLDALLTGFLDIGVQGATVLESRGMGSIIRQDMPIFAGLANLIPESTGSRVVLSVIPATLVDEVVHTVEQVVGELDKPNSAVCFTVPVGRFRGIRR